jgi:hypothetical protein
MTERTAFGSAAGELAEWIVVRLEQQRTRLPGQGLQTNEQPSRFAERRLKAASHMDLLKYFERTLSRRGQLNPFFHGPSMVSPPLPVKTLPAGSIILECVHAFD